MVIKSAEISDGLFSGFHTYIDINQVNKINDVIELVKEGLIYHFELYNMKKLIEVVKDTKFCISMRIEDILSDKNRHTIWLCEKCNSLLIDLPDQSEEKKPTSWTEYI